MFKHKSHPWRHPRLGAGGAPKTKKLQPVKKQLNTRAARREFKRKYTNALLRSLPPPSLPRGMTWCGPKPLPPGPGGSVPTPSPQPSPPLTIRGPRQPA